MAPKNQRMSLDTARVCSTLGVKVQAAMLMRDKTRYCKIHFSLGGCFIFRCFLHSGFN